MSKAVKAVKKVFKGVAKVVKKVVKGIASVGKKIVGGLGKVLGKLGPIGTLAIGFIAPYAIPTMIGSEIGWVSTIGKGLQAVSSAVAAPFKMAGQAIGKGVSFIGQGVGQSVGGSIGQGITSLTDKISGFLGYQGGSITDGATKIMDSVKGQWNEAFGTSFTPSTPQAPKILDLGKVQASGKADTLMGSVDFSTQPTIDVTKGTASITPGVVDNTVSPPNIFGFEGPKQVFDPTQANPFSEAYSKEQLGLIDVAKQYPDAQYTFDKTKTPTLPKLPSFGLSPTGTGSLLGMPEGESYAVRSSAAGDSRGFGSLGRSFSAQEMTGLLMTEALVQQMNALRGVA